MKRVILIILAALMLVACQPTPETSPVVNQNGTFEERADTTNTTEQDVMHGYTQETASGSQYPHFEKEYVTPKGITINLKADIIAPNAQFIPLIQVKACALTKEQINKLLNAFFEDENLYDASNGVPSTKEDISFSMQKMIDQLSLYEAQGDMDKASALSSTIEYLQEKYNAASPLSELQLREFDQSSFGSSFSVMARSERAGWAVFSIRDDPEYGLYNALYTNYGWNGCYTNHSDEGSTSLYSFADSKLEDAFTLLKNLEISDMSLSRTSFGYAYDYDTYVLSDNPESVRFLFTRSINGIPQPHSGGYAWYEQFALENSAEYNKPWQTEYITIEYDQHGLVSFSWFNPIEIKKVVNENIEVIHLDQALEIFDYVIDTFYSYFVNHDENNWGDWTTTLNVTKIQFGYQFRRIKNEADIYELVPCWLFFQNDSIILVLNAVDGTVFNSGLNTLGQ